MDKTDPAKDNGKQWAEKPIGVNKEERPGGNGKGVKVEKIRFGKTNNWVELLLIVTYDVQVRGQASTAEVCDDLHKLEAVVRDNTIGDALEALRKKEILAMAQNSDGHRVYSLKRVKFNCNPALMNLKSAMDELKNDAAGMLIVEKFAPEDGSTTSEKKETMPKEPALYQVTCCVKTILTGGQIWAGNPDLQENYFACPRWHTLHICNPDGSIKKDANGNYQMKPEYLSDPEVPMMFERTADGKICIANTAGLSGFLECNAEANAPSENVTRNWQMRKFCGLAPIIVEPEDRYFTVKRLPVIPAGGTRAGQGASAPKSYETLKGGFTFTFEFVAPSVNFITPWEMKKWLGYVLAYPIRSLSMSRGRQFGACALKDFKYRLLSSDSEEWLDPKPPNTPAPQGQA